MDRHRLLLFLICIALFSEAASAAKPAFPNEVTITVEGDLRIIRSNGIPDHEVGQFPNRGNPNTISPQHYEFRVPADPKPARMLTPLRMQPFGVAVNGVVFDPGAAEWWHRDRNSGWQYEPLFGNGILGVDQNHAHAQPDGAYHYHGIPTGLIAQLTGGRNKMVVVGWAADGFPIYNPFGHTDPADAASALKVLKSSYRLKKGTRPSGPGGTYDGTFVEDYEYVANSGDLDECNGRVAVTPEYPGGIYQYVLTMQFPYVPRIYRGTPAKSFAIHGPGAGRGPGGAGGRPGNGQGGGPDGAAGPGQRPPLPPILKALDADGDGIISADEIANAPAALKSLDTNGDGQLTRDEYLGRRGNGGGGQGDSERGPGGAGRRPIPLFMRALDADGDGIISADEIANASNALKKLDKNGDGELTPDEYMGPRPSRPNDDGPPSGPG